MHTSIIIYVYIFYLRICISLLFHYLLFIGVKNIIIFLVLVFVLVLTDGSVELF